MIPYGTVIAGVAGVLSALSYLSIFIALCLVAARREAPKKRRGLAIFALFLLFAGVNRVLPLTEGGPLALWWDLAVV